MSDEIQNLAKELVDQVQQFVGQPRILIVSDFDGTISHPRSKYEDAELDPVSRVALRKLSELPNTFVAVISSRPLANLSAKFHGLERVRLLGSYGYELEAGSVKPVQLDESTVSSHKGDALLSLQEQISPSATLFMGDNAADESAFKVLTASDIGVKVGEGQSAAKFRLQNSESAIQLFALIANKRHEWMQTTTDVPIDQHLFISDLRTAALVDNGGTITWFCTPRFDSAPLFGSIVGGPSAGYFRIRAEGLSHQQYLGNALIGKTFFDKTTVTDLLDCSSGRSYQRAGRTDLVRIIEGAGTVQVEFAPKFNFGRVPTRLSEVTNGLRIDCGQIPFVLHSPDWKWDIQREGQHDVARCERTLKNETLSLRLLVGTGSATSPLRSIDKVLPENKLFWESWLNTLKIPKTASELVIKSALVLRGLSYGPTGALVAAATTSLPEHLGGIRNWDYRYCWPRDACLSASALVRLGALEPAIRLLEWILTIVFDVENEAFLAPLYTVTGRGVPIEAEVAEAHGYRGSRPVRIGNLAAEQLQLDTLGPIAELMLRLAQQGVSLTTEHVQLAEHLVRLIELRWNDPDSGIWEIRGAQRHYTHSKLMCWYAVDCCIKVSRYLGTDREDWSRLAQTIRSQIETEGFDSNLNSYVSAYDLPKVDAALLWIVLTEFHSPDDPRSQGTLDLIIEQLYKDNAVYRYRFDDSLYGEEGEFIICRAWLIEALVMAGRKEEAQRFFDELVSRIGQLGLLPEQWETINNFALGNYPQAYSHLGLINAAYALDYISS